MQRVKKKILGRGNSICKTLKGKKDWDVEEMKAGQWDRWSRFGTGKKGGQKWGGD
jgi:hypothetical protein